MHINKRRLRKSKEERQEEERQFLRITKEATKSARRMPRRQGPKKDAVHCEKPRGVVCRRRSGGIRMGKPAWLKTRHSTLNT